MEKEAARDGRVRLTSANIILVREIKNGKEKRKGGQYPRVKTLRENTQGERIDTKIDIRHADHCCGAVGGKYEGKPQFGQGRSKGLFE